MLAVCMSDILSVHTDKSQRRKEKKRERDEREGGGEMAISQRNRCVHTVCMCLNFVTERAVCLSLLMTKWISLVQLTALWCVLLVGETEFTYLWMLHRYYYYWSDGALRDYIHAGYCKLLTLNVLPPPTQLYLDMRVTFSVYVNTL